MSFSKTTGRLKNKSFDVEMGMVTLVVGRDNLRPRLPFLSNFFLPSARSTVCSTRRTGIQKLSLVSLQFFGTFPSRRFPESVLQSWQVSQIVLKPRNFKQSFISKAKWTHEAEPSPSWIPGHLCYNSAQRQVLYKYPLQVWLCLIHEGWNRFAWLDIKPRLYDLLEPSLLNRSELRFIVSQSRICELTTKLFLLQKSMLVTSPWTSQLDQMLKKNVNVCINTTRFSLFLVKLVRAGNNK